MCIFTKENWVSKLRCQGGSARLCPVLNCGSLGKHYWVIGDQWGHLGRGGRGKKFYPGSPCQTELLAIFTFPNADECQDPAGIGRGNSAGMNFSNLLRDLWCWEHTLLMASVIGSYNHSHYTLDIEKTTNGKPRARATNPSLITSAQPHPIPTYTSNNQNVVNIATFLLLTVFKTAFRVTQDEDFLQCGGAPSQVIKVFAEGTGPGPDTSHLQWDFNHPTSSPWNQAVISQLMCLLVDMQNNWTIETRSDQYWAGKITQKLTWIKKCFDRAKPCVCDNLSVETSAEVATRLVNHKDETLMKARRDMQQQTMLYAPVVGKCVTLTAFASPVQYKCGSSKGNPCTSTSFSNLSNTSSVSVLIGSISSISTSGIRPQIWEI
ncbi:hypothetical protein EDD16DRAFT_1520543 [Pisolithus croceorrhizus]|nr:hypothetical protein EDD16DRAFT_1520543 [Pisolithus croceorrhizus]